jgi:hypothetical protein
MVKPNKGPSTRVRILVRFRIRFHALFAFKPNKDPILLLLLITHTFLHKQIKNKHAGEEFTNRCFDSILNRSSNE